MRIHVATTDPFAEKNVGSRNNVVNLNKSSPLYKNDLVIFPSNARSTRYATHLMASCGYRYLLLGKKYYTQQTLYKM